MGDQSGCKKTYKGGHLHEHLREEQLEQVGSKAEGDKRLHLRTISRVKRTRLAERLDMEGEKKEEIKENSHSWHEQQGGW